MRQATKGTWLFSIGLTAGTVGGLLISRRIAGGRHLPHRDAWRRALAETRGPGGAAMTMARAEARYDELCAQRPHFANHALRSHLQSNILPGLALYQVLREEGEDQEAALAEVGRLFATHLAPRRRLMQYLGRLPKPMLALAPWILRAGTPLVAPRQGWDLEIVALGRKLYATDVYHCFYLDILTAYGAPELTMLFCNTDDFIYGALAPGILWERTGTLSRGAECCDCCWRVGV